MTNSEQVLWTVERVEEWLVAQNGLTYEPTAIQIIRFLLDSLTSAREEARPAIDFVLEYAKNGCHHACTRGSCSHKGRQRQAEADKIAEAFK